MPNEGSIAGYGSRVDTPRWDGLYWTWTSQFVVPSCKLAYNRIEIWTIYINTYPIVRLVMKLICQRFWGPFCTAAGFGLGAVSFADSGWRDSLAGLRGGDGAALPWRGSARPEPGARRTPGWCWRHLLVVHCDRSGLAAYRPSEVLQVLMGHGFVWKCWELPKIWFRKSVYLWEVAILGYTLFFDTPDAFAVHFLRTLDYSMGYVVFVFMDWTGLRHLLVKHRARSCVARQQIYTRVARILISVNPFHSLPIYSAKWPGMHVGQISILQSYIFPMKVGFMLVPSLEQTIYLFSCLRGSESASVCWEYPEGCPLKLNGFRSCILTG